MIGSETLPTGTREAFICDACGQRLVRFLAKQTRPLPSDRWRFELLRLNPSLVAPLRSSIARMQTSMRHPNLVMIAFRQQNTPSAPNVNTDIFGAISLAFALGVTGGIIYLLWKIWRERHIEHLRAFADSLPQTNGWFSGASIRIARRGTSVGIPELSRSGSGSIKRRPPAHHQRRPMQPRSLRPRVHREVGVRPLATSRGCVVLTE